MLNPSQRHTGRKKSTKLLETLDLCGERSIISSAKPNTVLRHAFPWMTIMITFSLTRRLRAFDQRLQQHLHTVYHILFGNSKNCQRL